MFILFVLISPILAIKFQFVIPKREIKCFTDNLGSDIMVTGAITANSSQYSFKIFVIHPISLILSFRILIENSKGSYMI